MIRFRNYLFFIICILTTAIFFLEGISSAYDESGRPLSSNMPEKQGPDISNDDEVIVAIVNNIKITMKSLKTMMKSLEAGMTHSASREDTTAIEKEALNQLILQELSYQRAMSEGLNAEQPDIDRALADIKINFGDDAKYAEFLANEGISEDVLRERIRRNLVLKRIFKKEIIDKAVISEEELKNEYEREKEKYTKPERIVVVDVVLFLNSEDPGSLKKADEILEKITADKEKDPWNLVLDGTFIVRDLEIKDTVQDKKIYEEAKKLNVGELSGVFSSSGTLHIIKLKEYTPFQQFTYDEVKNFLARKLRSQLQKELLHDWESQLKKKATIEIIDEKLK